jgi:hypothetical protein
MPGAGLRDTTTAIISRSASVSPGVPSMTSRKWANQADSRSGRKL